MSETFDVLTYGCYIITASWENRLYGMTCSWATQIDKDRILLVMNKESSTAKAILKSGKFGISVLTRKQKQLALKFGEGHSDTRDKFEKVDYEIGKTGVPLLIGAHKLIECALEETSITKDESIFIGHISRFRYNNRLADPLLLKHIDG
jgi:flavin reductase (DIM6/NTAB) family NADH-FMN oxidoreductase RutF